MTREEAISIIQYTFLNVDNHLNGNGPKRDAKDINEALLMAIKALLNHSLPANLDEAAEEVNKSGLIGFEGVCWLTKETPKHFFKAGAEWMAGRGVSLTHLIAWYIQSVDASEPVWTEEHLEELVKDYILIPKN